MFIGLTLKFIESNVCMRKLSMLLFTSQKTAFQQYFCPMFTNIPPIDKTTSCTYTSMIHKKHPHKGDTQGIDASHIAAVLLTKCDWYKQSHTVRQYNNNPRLSKNGTSGMNKLIRMRLIYYFSGHSLFHCQKKLGINHFQPSPAILQ